MKFILLFIISVLSPAYTTAWVIPLAICSTNALTAAYSRAFSLLAAVLWGISCLEMVYREMAVPYYYPSLVVYFMAVWWISSQLKN